VTAVPGTVAVPAVGAPLAAAVCYSVAAVVQQVGARRAAGPAEQDPGPAGAPPPGPEGRPPSRPRLGVGLVVGLLRQPLFLLGLVLDGVGFGLAFVALRSLPLFVVEAAVASTVAVTALLGSRFLADRLTRRDWVFVGAVVVGLALVGASAAPGEARAPGALGRALLIAGVPALALAAVVLDRRRPPARSSGRLRAGPGGGSAAALGALSGFGFGAFAVAARLLPTHQGAAALLADPLLWAAVAYAAVGLAVYGAALQRGSLTAVTAAAIATESLLPSAVGLLVLSDGTRPGLAGAAIAGFALTVGAALGLAATRRAPSAGVVPRATAA
jgi:drug/metabolite transporter (DMT)-like permease